jgi:uncharacterized surface anchored protein
LRHPKHNKLIREIKTDKNGRFIIDSLVPKTYSLEAYKDNYAYHVDYNLIISKGEITKIGKVQLGEPIIEEDLKPVIYLYPEEETAINVQLEYDGELTHSYPKYPTDGWEITASPDGTLKDQNQKEYYALFWEGNPNKQDTPNEGFVIPGDQTVAFLEESLETLGLNRREANEFIMFWMPQMENNAYNFIHFSTKEYTDRAKLLITPKPETIIRVMMLTKPLTHRIDMPLQVISSQKIERKGFTVVEWGGSIITKNVDL